METENHPDPSPPEQHEAPKPIFKRWWFWLAIAGAAFACFLVFAWFMGHKQSGDKTSQKPGFITEHQAGNAIAYDSSLPTCPANLSGLLNHEIFDLADLDVAVPLGMLSPGGHTIPTDHMYINHGSKKRLAIYAPGDMTLISMDDKITYDSATSAKVRDDYSMQFALCKGLTIYLNHFSELEPKIKAAWDKAQKRCEEQYKNYFGADRTVYYMPCQSQFKVSFKSGELIGHAGMLAGGASDPYVSGIDLGAYNYNGRPLGFANPSRYSEDNLHAFCGLELFTKPLKDAYYSKLGSVEIDNGTANIVRRVGEPLCGATMQDVPGTLAGNWFAGRTGDSVTQTQYMMALATSVANANILEVSMQGPPELNGNTAIKFEPTHTGTINRQFSEVTPGAQIYCYQSTIETRTNIIDANGKPKGTNKQKFLVQLVDATHLKIEKQSGACTGGESFGSPFVFER